MVESFCAGATLIQIRSNDVNSDQIKRSIRYISLQVVSATARCEASVGAAAAWHGGVQRMGKGGLGEGGLGEGVWGVCETRSKVDESGSVLKWMEVEVEESTYRVRTVLTVSCLM